MEFDEGDVLYGRLRPYLNKVCRPTFAGLASAEFITFRDFNGITPEFLKYLLNQPGFVEFASRANEGDRPRVKWSQIQGFEFELPDLDGQQRIVEIIEEQFSRLDAGVGTLQRARRSLVGYRRAAVQAAIETDWPTAPLGHVAKVSGGIQKQPKRRPRANAYPYLRVANVLRGRLDLSTIERMELFEGELTRYQLKAGDLLIVEGNGSAGQIGRSAMWSGEIEECVHQNHIIRARPSDGLDPQFLNIYWNSPRAIRRITQVAASTSGLYTLSTSKVKAVPIPVPDLAIQQRVVAEVERQFSIIDAMAKAIDEQLQHAAALRQSILRHAFAGQLVPAA
jgi:type I restriction enzyme S subunit